MMIGRPWRRRSAPTCVLHPSWPWAGRRPRRAAPDPDTQADGSAGAPQGWRSPQRSRLQNKDEWKIHMLNLNSFTDSNDAFYFVVKNSWNKPKAVVASRGTPQNYRLYRSNKIADLEWWIRDHWGRRRNQMLDRHSQDPGYCLCALPTELSRHWFQSSLVQQFPAEYTSITVCDQDSMLKFLCERIWTFICSNLSTQRWWLLSNSQISNNNVLFFYGLRHV